MKWRKREVREPKRRHKPIGARDEKRERVSKWKAKPPPGDSITVVLVNEPGKCAKVTVRQAKNGLPAGSFVYSSKIEPSPATNDPLLWGTTGVARYADRGVTWAWGWTTPEARALEVAARLRV